MHPQNAMLETAQELRSARPRTGEPNATFGCTEASIPAWPCFHVHSINASVGPSPDETTTATWRYQRNQQYSITAITTSAGAIAERYAYSAYGEPTILDGSGSVLSSSAINNRYMHTGREWDQTLGLYHFRARWMSGITGKFLGRDPIGYADGNTRLYSLDESLNAVDPSGLFSVTDVSDFLQDLSSRYIAPTGFTVYGNIQLPACIAPGVCMYFRVQVDWRTGSCKCPCEQFGSYVSHVSRFEIGVSAGMPQPSIGLAVPIVENIGICPSGESMVVTGGITFRFVVGPLVGTCNYTYPDGFGCNMSVRLTNLLRRGVFQMQVGGFITLTYKSGMGCV